MVENRLQFTNAVIEMAIERFSAVLGKSDNFTYFQVVDSEGIRASIGIIYLTAVMMITGIHAHTHTAYTTNAAALKDSRQLYRPVKDQ